MHARSAPAGPRPPTTDAAASAVRARTLRVLDRWCLAASGSTSATTTRNARRSPSSPASTGRGRSAAQSRCRRSPSRQPVAPAGHGEGEARTSSTDGAPTRCASTSSGTPGTMSLASWSTACCGIQGQVGEHDRAGRPAGRRPAPGPARRRPSDTPTPPPPVTATSGPCHLAPAPAASTSAASRRGMGAAWVRSASRSGGGLERRRQHRRGAEGPPVLGHQSRRRPPTRTGAMSTTSRSMPGSPPSRSTAETGRPDATRARSSATDTHGRYSTGTAPAVAHRATSPDHAAPGVGQPDDDVTARRTSAAREGPAPG